MRAIVLAAAMVIIVAAVVPEARGQFGFKARNKDGTPEAEPNALSDKGKTSFERIEAIKVQVSLETAPFSQARRPDDAERAMNEARALYEEAKGLLDDISIADQRHERYGPAKAFVTEFAAQIETWERGLANFGRRHEEALELRTELKVRARNHDELLRLLRTARDEKKQSFKGVTGDTAVPLEAWAGLDKLETLARDCENRFYGIPDSDFQTDYEPSKVCPLVSARQSILSAYLVANVEKALADQTHLVEEQVERYKAEGLVLSEWAESFADFDGFLAQQVERAKPVYDAVGQELPQPLFDGMKAAKEAFDAEVKAGTRKHRFPKKKARDRVVDQEIRGLLKDISIVDKPIQVKLLHVIDRDWEVKKDDQGIAQFRKKRAAVLLKVKGEKLCRHYEAWLVQEFSGGASYKEPGDADIARSFRFLRCR